jgi:hypothetical protein
LKHFSLSGSLLNPTFCYDTFIVPLLGGMINLEELQLFLRVQRFDSTYIDGNQLYSQFLVYMTKLKKFTFDIKTKVRNQNVNIKLPSNEEIQSSFVGRIYPEVFSYVTTNSSNCDGECHFYSLPYDFQYFFNVDNSFQGGTFEKVRQLEMKDKIPFERQLFQRISQDFPFLKYLYIINDRAMKNKPYLFTLITFPHLTFLDLDGTHQSYAVLFLFKKHVHLPRLSHLCIEQETLKKITNNFTIDSMHFNFRELKTLDVGEPLVRPKNFHVYFPILSMYQ